MTAHFYLDGVLLPYQTVRLNGGEGGVAGLPSSAWYGEPAIAGLTIEDPAGALELEGWHEFWVDEPNCAKPRIFTGWLFDSEISRGPYTVGAGRVWSCNIIDQNALFSFLAIRASSGKRPAETDLERAAWIQASGPMSYTPAYDNGRFNTTDNPINFNAADYVTRFPVEVFNSIVGVAGKNFYSYFDDSAQQISLHYDLFTAGPAAGISISNVPADTSNGASTTVYGPSRDAVLRRSPEKQYTGILLGYIGGQYVYGVRQATIDDIGSSVFSPGGFQRDLVYTTDRVGRVETANSILTSMLEAHAGQRDVISFTVQLPDSKVNLAHAGDVIPVRFQHLPGYETATDVVIIRRNVLPTPYQMDLYDVTFEVAPEGLNRGPDGGDPDDFPQADPCSGGDITLVQYEIANHEGNNDLVLTFPSQATSGNLLYLFISFRGISTAGAITGWTLSPEGTSTIDNDDEQSVATYYKTSDGTETSVTLNWTPNTNFQRATFIEFTGIDVLDESAVDSDINSLIAPGGTVTPASGTVGLVVTGWGYNTGGDTFPYDPPTISGGAGTPITNRVEGDHPVTVVAYQVVAPASGSPIQHIATFSGFSPNGDESSLAQTMVFLCSGGANVPPAAGMWVRNEQVGEGDGSTVTFTTRFPYASGSLQVFVDGVPIINGLTETDPDAGTFTLDFAPLGASGDTRAEIVTVNYQGNVGGPG